MTRHQPDDARQDWYEGGEGREETENSVRPTNLVDVACAWGVDHTYLPSGMDDGLALVCMGHRGPRTEICQATPTQGLSYPDQQENPTLDGTNKAQATLGVRSEEVCTLYHFSEMQPAPYKGTLV